jgi:hypothetical protein
MCFDKQNIALMKCLLHPQSKLYPNNHVTQNCWIMLWCDPAVPTHQWFICCTDTSLLLFNCHISYLLQWYCAFTYTWKQKWYQTYEFPLKFVPFRMSIVVGNLLVYISQDNPVHKFILAWFNTNEYITNYLSTLPLQVSLIKEWLLLLATVVTVTTFVHHEIWMPKVLSSLPHFHSCFG